MKIKILNIHIFWSAVIFKTFLYLNGVKIMGKCYMWPQLFTFSDSEFLTSQYFTLILTTTTTTAVLVLVLDYSVTHIHVHNACAQSLNNTGQIPVSRRMPPTVHFRDSHARVTLMQVSVSVVLSHNLNISSACWKPGICTHFFCLYWGCDLTNAAEQGSSRSLSALTAWLQK